jgi:hypothetical protein
MRDDAAQPGAGLPVASWRRRRVGEAGADRVSDGTVDPVDRPALPPSGRRVTPADVERMVDRLLLSGPDAGRKRSSFWALLLLSAAIASAGVMMDSTATVIGAMIVAPLMVPILGTALALVLSQRTAMLRSLGTVLGGALAVIAVGYLFGLLDPLGVAATANTQIAGRIHPRLIDLVAALATGTVGAFALARSDVSDALPGSRSPSRSSRPSPWPASSSRRRVRGRRRRDPAVRDQRDGHRGHGHGRVPGLPRP